MNDKSNGKKHENSRFFRRLYARGRCNGVACMRAATVALYSCMRVRREATGAADSLCPRTSTAVCDSCPLSFFLRQTLLSWYAFFSNISLSFAHFVSFRFGHFILFCGARSPETDRSTLLSLGTVYITRLAPRVDSNSSRIESSRIESKRHRAVAPLTLTGSQGNSIFPASSC